MHDTQLYERIMGLSAPWFVQRVELDIQEGQVDVYVEHRAGVEWSCGQCGKPSPLYDHAEERGWRHLDTCQFRTFLHARPPRVKCAEHGVCNASLPWAEPGARFTMLMERWLIDVLTECRNISAACRLTGISWDEGSGVIGRAVERGLHRRGAPTVRYLGVDEKRYRRGRVYVTVVSDIESGAVLEVTEKHDTESLAAFYRSLSPDQLQGIQAVAMDMWDPFAKATREHVPDGEQKIVYDRFHIMRKTHEELEAVRRTEHRELRREGDTTLERARQMLLWADENRPEKYADRMKALQQRDLHTAKAWAMKENLRRLWDEPNIPRAREFFERWSQWVTQSAIKPMIRLAKTLTDKLEGVLRYCQHHITTGGCESINGQIAGVIQRAAGYRNFDRFRQAILFFCGRLDLYPK